MHRLFPVIFAILNFTAAAKADLGELPERTASEASLVAEERMIAPGKSCSVALKISLPEGWHSYYQNSGGVEIPLAMVWKLPPGFTAGPIQWPVPEVKDGYFGKSFVYQDSPVFIVDITAPADLKPGDPVTLTANATWQICKDSCINEKKALALTLATAATSEKDPAAGALFKEARAAQATKAPAWKTTATSDGGDVLIRIEPDTKSNGALTDFIPNQPFLQPASAGGTITRDGDAWVVSLKRKTKDAFEKPIPQGVSLSGILVGTPSLEISETTIGSAPAKSLPFAAYLKIIGGMLIGGLILNLMPCVFPVIGLKIMGFVQQSGEDRKTIALHGISFTGGVLLSFGILSGILFAIRSSSNGWGYQLQNPWVVMTLMLVMFVLALNMYGVFEMGTSATSVGGSLQSKQGLAGSFFSGVLATVVATPCSGPFLGVAIGAAYALPALQFFTAFAAMAIGLSLPYLVLSVFPVLVNFLPRPGAWMESFKQAMSFFLFATAGFMLWVYAGQIELENLLGPIFGLSAIAIAAWIYGRWNLPHRPRATRWTAIALTIIFSIGGCILSKPPHKSGLVWEKWSQQRVDELLASGAPVYVDFTAQWCPTCQVNKHNAYSSEIVSLMKQKGVVTLRGDKTNANPDIEAKLQELHRAAIPVNVLYVPGKEPIITPELLSSGYLKELFSKEIPDAFSDK